MSPCGIGERNVGSGVNRPKTRNHYLQFDRFLGAEHTDISHECSTVPVDELNHDSVHRLAAGVVDSNHKYEGWLSAQLHLCEPPIH